jgi:hypothetical protein
MKSGKQHRIATFGLVFCSIMVTIAVNAQTVHKEETYNLLQPTTTVPIETIPNITTYVQSKTTAVKKAQTQHKTSTTISSSTTSSSTTSSSTTTTNLVAPTTSSIFISQTTITPRTSTTNRNNDDDNERDD